MVRWANGCRDRTTSQRPEGSPGGLDRTAGAGGWMANLSCRSASKDLKPRLPTWRSTMRRTLLAVLLLIPLRLLAQPDTRLLHSPTVSRDHIAFVYADDLWICDLDSRNVRRLT